MAWISRRPFRSAAFCGFLILSGAALAGCCTQPTNTPPPPPPPPAGSPVACIDLLLGTYAGPWTSGSLSVNVPQPPPERPGIKHNVQIGGTGYAGWCMATMSTSMNITGASGNSNDPPIAVWLLTQGTNGSNIHVQDDGNHNGTSPTQGLNEDLSPQ